MVTPFVGVWIEILMVGISESEDKVTPFVGVWIEIKVNHLNKKLCYTSLPSWECGLKLRYLIPLYLGF